MNPTRSVSADSTHTYTFCVEAVEPHSLFDVFDRYSQNKNFRHLDFDLEMTVLKAPTYELYCQEGFSIVKDYRRAQERGVPQTTPKTLKGKIKALSKEEKIGIVALAILSITLVAIAAFCISKLANAEKVFFERPRYDTCTGKLISKGYWYPKVCGAVYLGATLGALLALAAMSATVIFAKESLDNTSLNSRSLNSRIKRFNRFAEKLENQKEKIERINQALQDATTRLKIPKERRNEVVEFVEDLNKTLNSPLVQL